MNSNAPVGLVRKMLTHGLDPNERNLTERTAVHYAVQNKSLPEMLSLLLECGGDPNAPDKVRRIFNRVLKLS